MTEKHLSKLNRTLRDTCGRSQTGTGEDGLYKWVQSRNLTYPMRVDGAMRCGDLWLPGHHYEWVPQLEEYGLDRWILAMWKEPPTQPEWERMFGRDMPWPQNGLYYATDIILREGVEPTEWLTHDVIAKIKTQRLATFRDCLNLIRENRAAREKEEAANTDDWLKNVTTSWDSVPGARGGPVSFGGVSPEDFKSSENSEQKQ